MLFKTRRIQEEFDDLKTRNPKLHGILTVTEAAYHATYGNDLTLTCILRTKEENDDLYAATPVDKRPASSPHMRWEAADLRTKCLNDEQIDFLLKELNSNEVYGGKRKCALYHEILGNAKHLHVQSNPCD